MKRCAIVSLKDGSEPNLAPVVGQALWRHLDVRIQECQSSSECKQSGI